MDKQKLIDAGIDYDSGLERFLNDTKFYELILNAFIESDAINKIQDAFSEQNIKDMFTYAHEIKGSSGNAGLNELYSKACSLVIILRSTNEFNEELINSYNEFIFEYKKVYDGIKEAFK